MDRLMSSLGFGGGAVSVGVGGKGHSDSSTLSSQPSIDEVRQQMHLLLDSAFGLAPAEPSAVVATSSSSSAAAAAAVAVAANGHAHHHHQYHHHGQHSSYAAHHPSPYSDGVTSAPGTMNHPAPPLQRGSSFEPDMHQCSLPKPVRIFTVIFNPI